MPGRICPECGRSRADGAPQGCAGKGRYPHGRQARSHHLGEERKYLLPRTDEIREPERYGKRYHGSASERSGLRENPMDTTQPCGCSCITETASVPCGCTEGKKETPAILTATSSITVANRFDHFLARWGVNRTGHTVIPGLYRLGNPDEDSPVFASANYTLSFDALRSALAGIDAYLLVLDTKGINVWCAAGKGTFGTAELCRSIGCTDLAHVVRHRTIILPQLGAPGVSWPEVIRRSGFRV